MRDKSQILLEQAYSLVRESRAAGQESQAAGEEARLLAIEKTLIKSITEDLMASASHLNNIKPLLGVFESGTEALEFQGLSDALQAVSEALQGLQSRIEGSGESSDQGFPEVSSEPPVEDVPPTV